MPESQRPRACEGSLLSFVGRLMDCKFGGGGGDPPLGDLRYLRLVNSQCNDRHMTYDI